MADELSPYYASELRFFRKQGADFADKNKMIAARLRLGPQEAKDPHVERLIEAFAYMNARIRHKLDDDFPEIAQALLGVLYPHYLAPIPSMAIVKFELDDSQAESPSDYKIKRHTLLETEPIDGFPCRFRTCYPVSLWPIGVAKATLSRPPFQAPWVDFLAKVNSVLRLSLKCVSPVMTFALMGGGAESITIRFFLNAPLQHVYDLYELILNNRLGVTIAKSGNVKEGILLPPDCLKPVGFNPGEEMLPYPNRSFPGYCLLTEFFAFPQKFLFFDLTIPLGTLSVDQRDTLGNAVDLFIYLDRAVPDLEPSVSKETFELGCAPVVNLFAKTADSIRLAHTHAEYHVVPDQRSVESMEIYSIDKVEATSPDNETLEFKPFYSFAHSMSSESQKTFWHATRRQSSMASDGVDMGTELHLSLVDLGFSPSVIPDWTLHIETTCLNRDLPGRLPFGGGQPRLQMPEGGPIASITCLTPPTETRRPPLHKGTLWALISHLSLNHLSLTGADAGKAEDAAHALREILQLYDFANGGQTEGIISGIKRVSAARGVGRVWDGLTSSVCRGVDLSIEFDEAKFVGSGVFLFSAVLDRFLGLYCSINSFSRLEARTSKGVLRRWAPRSGDKQLL